MAELKKYDYRPVKCTKCDWRGRRGNRVVWPACPKCYAPGHLVEFIDAGVDKPIGQPDGSRAARAVDFINVEGRTLYLLIKLLELKGYLSPRQRNDWLAVHRAANSWLIDEATRGVHLRERRELANVKEEIT